MINDNVYRCVQCAIADTDASVTEAYATALAGAARRNAGKRLARNPDELDDLRQGLALAFMMREHESKNPSTIIDNILERQRSKHGNKEQCGYFGRWQRYCDVRQAQADENHRRAQIVRNVKERLTNPAERERIEARWPILSGDNQLSLDEQRRVNDAVRVEREARSIWLKEQRDAKRRERLQTPVPAAKNLPIQLDWGNAKYIVKTMYVEGKKRKKNGKPETIKVKRPYVVVPIASEHRHTYGYVETMSTVSVRGGEEFYRTEKRFVLGMLRFTYHKPKKNCPTRLRDDGKRVDQPRLLGIERIQIEYLTQIGEKQTSFTPQLRNWWNGEEYIPIVSWHLEENVTRVHDMREGTLETLETIPVWEPVRTIPAQWVAVPVVQRKVNSTLKERRKDSEFRRFMRAPDAAAGRHAMIRNRPRKGEKGQSYVWQEESHDYLTPVKTVNVRCPDVAIVLSEEEMNTRCPVVMM